ncbi:MAG TPA: efflux RND transporter permease subunit [Gemmatimonadaceae bacterium]|nr:efflux RND transporter permease subunit [Gemmatimonadaceae bacterium]
MNFVRFTLRYPQVALVLCAIAFLVGVQALLTMPRREDPKVPWRVALVIAAYPGATADQVEEQVTRRVEERLFRFAEVKRSRTVSISRPGLMVIEVWVEDDVIPEMFWSKLRHDMNETGFMDLPKGVLGPIVNSEFGDVSAMLIAVQGERYGYRELLDYTRRIEDNLRTLPQVSKIKRMGEQKEQIYVTSTMERVTQFGITPLNIIQALQQQNAVVPAGALTGEQARIPLRTGGLYAAEDQIKRQIVGASPRTGQPIYLGDFANVERRYKEPESLLRVNGSPALMLSLEMNEGYNIVDFGNQVRERLEKLRQELPPDLRIVTVADQPRVVKERVGHFLVEFGIAIVAVIAVTLLLLPLRVAAIAATAIPVTVAMTFAAMRAVGIELHQVSLAGLIVVLGLVVDDAIVVADNFVDLREHGVPLDEAAERSASDLAIPILTATLTIIASFLPMAFMPGTTGEFIFSLPVTVAVALACSLIVAMMLTPLLCRAWLKEPPHAAATGEAKPKRRFDLLGGMQSVYDSTITWGMAHKRATMAGGIGVVLVGFGLFAIVPQRFFPAAERDQFVINVWMPSGSSLEATDSVMRRIEAAVKVEREVVSSVSFVGESAPRFYYAYDPAFPTPNLGTVIVNTVSLESTTELVERLRASLPRLVPEAELNVYELQQGTPTESPVEARISGPDVQELRRLGDRVRVIFENARGSRLVRTNFREEYSDVLVDINSELANRLGMSQAGIAQTLAGSYLGAPVSTYWEGSRALDIVLRVDESRRGSFDDLRDMYLVSPITGARVPLREVATLRPEWQNSRIVRRNGVRTLTVGAHTTNDVLPSKLLASVQKQVQAIPLPPGYSLAWGGEIENQIESFGSMTVALMISLVSIFLILLFQFRRVSDALIVMASIPTTVFGAILGLLITGNPFGFTAFLGLISLSGVVVRNAIILLEYIHERMKHGVSVETAALEAGQRRLRPIFLTSAAAAAGVIPMILGGSSLWAPVGSVIAVGILCSMVFTLVTVPVLYVLVHGKETAAVPAPVVAGHGALKTAPAWDREAVPAIPIAADRPTHDVR